MRKLNLCAFIFLILVSAACSTVNVTKTAKGIYLPTKPAEVEIKGLAPQSGYEEIGMVSGNIYGNDPSTAYNTIRKKAAAIGADAVVLSNQMPYGGRILLNGVAIKYKDE
jgi:hypothetical protein